MNKVTLVLKNFTTKGTKNTYTYIYHTFITPLLPSEKILGTLHDHAKKKQTLNKNSSQGKWNGRQRQGIM